MTSQLLREKRKITRNLQGIRNMGKLPGCMVVVDVNRETNALREARSLGIPTICLIDTDGDPDMADVPIPGNDDSMRSIEVIIRELCDAVNKGKAGRAAAAKGAAGGEDSGSGGSRRRSSRSQFRSDDASPPVTEIPATDAPGESMPSSAVAEPATE